jgi:hypothetical protein
MAKNSDRPSFNCITPKGTAIYPKLDKPDTKFDADGVYEVKLKFDPAATDGVIGKTSATWAEIVEKAEAVRDEFLATTKKELAAGDGKQKLKAKNITALDFGNEQDVDDDGNETGLVLVKAKMKASGVSKKDGKPWARKPTLFDSKGKPLPANAPPIWGGSQLKVAAEVCPYYNAKDNVVGITLRLNAVQVIELVSGQGRTASAFGFGEEEGGYTAEEEQSFNAGGDAADAGDEGF